MLAGITGSSINRIKMVVIIAHYRTERRFTAFSCLWILRRQRRRAARGAEGDLVRWKAIPLWRRCRRYLTQTEIAPVPYKTLPEGNAFELSFVALAVGSPAAEKRADLRSRRNATGKSMLLKVNRLRRIHRFFFRFNLFRWDREIRIKFLSDNYIHSSHSFDFLNFWRK